MIFADDPTSHIGQLIVHVRLVVSPEWFIVLLSPRHANALLPALYRRFSSCSRSVVTSLAACETAHPRDCVNFFGTQRLDLL